MKLPITFLSQALFKKVYILNRHILKTKFHHTSLNKCQSIIPYKLGASFNFSTCISQSTIGRDENIFFKDELAQLQTHFPIIVEELTEAISQYKTYPGLQERLKTLLEYTVPNENAYFLTTALIPLYSYKAVEEFDRMTDTNMKTACVMAWVYRMLEVSQIIIDDIIDHSDVRYNKPVWYKNDGVTLELAILDSHCLATGAYMLLLKHLKNHPCCVDIVNLYVEHMFMTTITQFMDIDKLKTDEFMKFIHFRFDKALYIFDGSIRSGLYLANIRDKETHEIMKRFTVPMSRFFQVQNDFSGSFVTTEKFERECPDIMLGRNSWLVATALKVATPTQRKVIEDNYGNGDPESARKVFEIYKELKIDELHKEKSNEFQKEMYRVIDNFPRLIPKKPFQDLVQQLVLNKLYS